jgi:hypothetical protein
MYAVREQEIEDRSNGIFLAGACGHRHSPGCLRGRVSILREPSGERR